MYDTSVARVGTLLIQYDPRSSSPTVLQAANLSDARLSS